MRGVPDKLVMAAMIIDNRHLSWQHLVNPLQAAFPAAAIRHQQYIGHAGPINRGWRPRRLKDIGGARANRDLSLATAVIARDHARRVPVYHCPVRLRTRCDDDMSSPITPREVSHELDRVRHAECIQPVTSLMLGKAVTDDNSAVRQMPDAEVGAGRNMYRTFLGGAGIGGLANLQDDRIIAVHGSARIGLKPMTVSRSCTRTVLSD